MNFGKYVRKYSLIPNDSYKSFYGKAVVREFEHGSVLMSYGTPVVAVDEFGKIHRLWNGYSATTMRHVNAFMADMKILQGGKSWWDQLPVEKDHVYIEHSWRVNDEERVLKARFFA